MLRVNDLQSSDDQQGLQISRLAVVVAPGLQECTTYNLIVERRDSNESIYLRFLLPRAEGIQKETMYFVFYIYIAAVCRSSVVLSLYHL